MLIRVGVYLDKLIEKCFKGLESIFKILEDYGIDYDEVIVRGNVKDELLKFVNSGKYEIIVLSNWKVEDNKKFVLGSVSYKVVKCVIIFVLIVK